MKVRNTFPAAGGLIAAPWRDLGRYLRIRGMSKGGGHPEKVPVGGSRAYPRHQGQSAADGTGDFDSARRGGPANIR